MKSEDQVGENPASLFSRFMRGDLTLAQVKTLAKKYNFEFFSRPLGSPFELDDASWSPNMAISWIAFRSLDEVNEISESRLRIAGFWRKRPSPIPVSLEYEAEQIDLLGQSYFDLRTHELMWFWQVNDAKAVAPKVPDAKREFWKALIAGKISASGLRNGNFPRVSIPSYEWNDLRFSPDSDTFLPIGRPDTLFTPDGQFYRRVRVLADDVRHCWRQDELADALREAANQNGGTVTQEEAEVIAQGIGVSLPRSHVRDTIKRLGVDGKQGRRRKTP